MVIMGSFGTCYSCRKHLRDPDPFDNELLLCNECNEIFKRTSDILLREFKEHPDKFRDLKPFYEQLDILKVVPKVQMIK